VNFLAHVFLTMILLPSIREARNPRIICTTSCLQYLGKFDLANVNSGINGYPNNKLYFQAWLTELQYRLSIHANYKHIAVLGVHPCYVKTNIWHPPQENTSVSFPDWVLNGLLKYVGIDAQQGSLAITYAATAKECGLEARKLHVGKESGKDMYRSRIWKEEPMPQTMDPEHCWKIWEYVNKELKLEEKGLLKDFDM
jgi:NAD(P)-dependent dehydrogenase (short-subunit alcohol dehydrogenase family)